MRSAAAQDIGMAKWMHVGLELRNSVEACPISPRGLRIGTDKHVCVGAALQSDWDDRMRDTCVTTEATGRVMPKGGSVSEGVEKWLRELRTISLASVL